ncbi:RHS repeat-associated core domain-containing protein [Rubrivirga sp.]|uniref:RHS repeat-associated core domain-containing protein n=1 Tax=Rubrivirga sp. TaxID=1885344 RepID=UPI003B529244
MASQTGLRKDTRGYVVAKAPDVCKIANGTPTPFPIFAQFSDAIREVSTVRFEGKPATNLNARISRVVGDELGVGGGVTSQVNLGMCRPSPASVSPTFRVGGEWLIHSERTEMEMNCNGPDGPGNTIGVVTWATTPPTGVSVGPNGEILGLTNPPVLPETEEEKGFFGRMADKVKGAASAVGDAVSNMSVMDAVHLGLDVVGLVPGLGEIADGANALLYLAEGDYTNAALSAAAMIPFAGAAATGAKFARRADALAGVVRAADKAADAVKAAGRAGRAVASRAGRALAEKGGKIMGGAARRVRGAANRVWCFSDPVDAISGEVVIDAVDVELPGPLPLQLGRTWMTGSTFEGRFGPGWTSTLDASVLVNRAQGVAVLRLESGAVVELVLPAPGAETWARDLGVRLIAEASAVAAVSGDGQAGAPPVLGGPASVWPMPAETPVRRYRALFDDGTSLVFGRAGTVYWPDAERSGQLWALARIEDAAGNAITIEPDDRGLAITDSAGRRLDVETDRAGRVVAIAGPDPDGRRQPAVLAQFAYDGEGRLVSARDATGEPERYHHDADGRIVAETFRGGARFHWEYRAFTSPDGDLETRCVRAWGETPDGRDGLLDYTFDYDLDEGVTRVTDTRGGVTVVDYGADGRVREATDPLGRVTRYAYDPNTGARTAVTDPLGHTTRFGYTRDGDLAQIAAPDGATWQLAYDDARRPTSFTDPSGSTWTRAYDDAGRLAEETDPTGATTRYRYDARGLPTEIEDALRQSVLLTWDAAGQLVATTDRTGATTRYAYDALGRLTSRVDAEGGETVFVYDTAGRLLRRTDRVAGQERGPSRTTRFAYDAAGNVAAVTDPDGAVRRFAHDPLFDLVTAVTQPSGAVTRYAYDAEGDLSTVTDATGRDWSFARDLAGQVVEEVDFTGRRLAYGYDPAGRLVESVDARGFVTRMQRDAAGRLTERTHAAGTDSEATETFAYDAGGRMSEAANGTVAVGFAYDAVGRVTEEWQRLADGTLAGTPLDGSTAVVRSTYDALGRRVGRATPAGRDLAFGHDAEGRLTSVADGAGPLVRSSLDKLGRPKRRAMGADVGTAPAAVGLRSYTAFGELAEQRVVRDAGPGRVGLAEVFRRTYAHDGAGRITAVEDSRWARGPGGPEAATLAFGHDPDGRLASSVLPDRGLAAYEADAAGNVPAAPVRLPAPLRPDGGEADGGGVVSVQVAEGWTLGYDADGNLLSKRDTSGRHGGASWRYAYDATGRLAEVWRDGGAGEIQVGAYGYDVLGRRVARHTWAEDGSGLDERVVWDGDVPAERQRAERDPLARAASGAVASGAVAVRTYAFQGFEPVALLDGEADVAVVECDQVGQPRLAVDREGTLVWEGRFDPWGGEVAVGPVEVSGPEVEVRFPGQVADAESGLRYNRFRYYDPETRTYGQSDPAGLRGGLRSHCYVADPVEWVDLFGLGGCNIKKRLHLGDAGHHVPAVRKSKGRPFEVGRSDKTRPTLHFRGADPGHDHWRLHDAERAHVGPRQGDFVGSDDELFDAYRQAYSGLDDVRVDVKSPNGTHVLGTDVSPRESVDLIDDWLRSNGQR